MSYSTARASLLSVLSGPPQTLDERHVFLSVLFLTMLLVVAVPVVAVSTGVPTLVLVAVAGLLYGIVLVVTDTVFEGLCGAVFVLCTFSGNLPIFERMTEAGATQLSLMLVDFVAIPLAVLFLCWNRGFSIPTGRRLETVVGYALAGVVVWSVLAAIVSNGPSRFGALTYVVMQARYLLLFAVVVGIVRYTGLRTALSSLLVALGGQLSYAIAEVLNRGSFGLTYLGDVPGMTIGTFFVGPVAFQSSMYAGGFVGTSRGLLLLVVLLSPILIERVVNGSSVQRVLSVAYLLASVFVVRVSATDAGWMAFLLALLAVAGMLTYVGYASDILDSTAETIHYLYGYLCAFGMAVLSVLLFSGREILVQTTTGIQGRSDVHLSAVTLSIAELLQHVPFVGLANLVVRIQQYVVAIEIGLTYPLFGLGGRNFPLVAESYGFAQPIAVHSVYFSYLADIGFVGTVLFLVAFVLPAVVALGETVRTDGDDRLLWGMSACGLVGFYAYSFWTTGYTIPAASLTFWAFAGTIVGARRRRTHTGRDDANTVAT